VPAAPSARRGPTAATQEMGAARAGVADGAVRPDRPYKTQKQIDRTIVS